ncbi:ATP-binding protein [Clostridium tyrobutyricum]|jgi:DNA replication protein DnaC|uniref:DNA replication protein DnaC n=1 Tax=Clostridium tyrobutyricum DIVETGP TaxID=1408889 RepID=W6N6W3_CLOTY|nr:ATP-binding protein [Clostridium tyrobutyricum]AND86248.1 DNA replication protein DnaC [Clostridium tyrobutyricum]ANP70739.1 DNA replication protein DnaC [Clostridium tyrobutyricum]MBR9648152.1 ATP-binding protein [Clostridium tyrobutyricum]MBV4416937.1 ATP-binding protein [Clostridium tyrobutyricum]MBV4422713.1 ATP-binding protein [Clostridium tyrobutyricum]
MIKGYHSDIMKIYERIQSKEKESLQKRKIEISKILPEISNIEKQIGLYSVKISMELLKNKENTEKHLKQLKEKITELRIKKSELLVANNYPMDYLEIKYKCPKCRDTGFIGTKKCSCYKQKLVKLYYKNSDLINILNKNNFENYNPELFSSQRSEEDHRSPRKNIEIIASKSWNFIENFANSTENLLFYGTAGTGKTFMSNCIAKELLDKGYLVIYRTSEMLIQNLRTIRFANDEKLKDLLLNCDLLIIDDLGSEQITDFSKTELFNILNMRLLKQKKMLISTNCELENILKMYSERISSRLLGNFTLFKFFGEDIRIKQNIKSKRF